MARVAIDGEEVGMVDHPWVDSRLVLRLCSAVTRLLDDLDDARCGGEREVVNLIVELLWKRL